MSTGQKRLLIMFLLSTQVSLAVFAWRDIAGRNDEQIRGTKKAWRASIILNPGNAIFYWFFGRR